MYHANLQIYTSISRSDNLSRTSLRRHPFSFPLSGFSLFFASRSLDFLISTDLQRPDSICLSRVFPILYFQQTTTRTTWTKTTWSWTVQYPASETLYRRYTEKQRTKKKERRIVGEKEKESLMYLQVCTRTITAASTKCRKIKTALQERIRQRKAKHDCCIQKMACIQKKKVSLGERDTSLASISVYVLLFSRN